MTDNVKLLESPDKPVEDVDFEENRKFLYDLRDKAMAVLDKAEDILDEHEHPRAVETFSGLLKNIGEINNQILRMSKTHKELKSPSVKRTGVIPLNSDGNGGTITNNITANITEMSNVDLQKQIREAMEAVKAEDKTVDLHVVGDVVDAEAVDVDENGNEIKEIPNDGAVKVEPI